MKRTTLIAPKAIDIAQRPAVLTPQRHARFSLENWAFPLLVLITLLVMGRVCFGQFTSWDDDFNVRFNPAFLPPTAASMWHIWAAPQFMQYIPLSYTLWGLISWATQITDASGHLVQVPWAFHSANLLIHIIAALLVFDVLRLLHLAPIGCLYGALLFAIHPVQVESVAWASGFRDVLSGALSLAAVQQYLLYARAENEGRARMHYGWATIAFLSAILAKNSAMTLPLTIAAIDRWAVRRPWRQTILSTGPWLLIAIPVAIVARLLQDTSLIRRVPLWTRPFIAADSITFYLGKLVRPIDLVVDYGRSPQAVLAAGHCYWEWLIPIAIAVALIAGRRKRPLLLLAGLIFLFGTLPVLGLSAATFQQISTTADRYLYFSMFGASVALAWLLTAYPNPFLRSITLLALLACCVLANRQVGYWKDNAALWSHELTVNPKSVAAYDSIGIDYAESGDYPRAIDAFTRAADLMPENQITFDNLASALHESGRLSDAINAKRRALDVERDAPTLRASWARDTAELGAFLCEAGRYAEALPYLQSAHAIAPHDRKVNFLLQRATTQATEKSGPRPAGRG